ATHGVSCGSATKSGWQSGSSGGDTRYHAAKTERGNAAAAPGTDRTGYQIRSNRILVLRSASRQARVGQPGERTLLVAPRYRRHHRDVLPAITPRGPGSYPTGG